MDIVPQPRRAELVGLTKQDADARVRHRAHWVLAVLDSRTRAEASGRVAVSDSQLGR